LKLIGQLVVRNLRLINQDFNRRQTVKELEALGATALKLAELIENGEVGEGKVEWVFAASGVVRVKAGFIATLVGGAAGLRWVW
jgi:hypothetical protein